MSNVTELPNVEQDKLRAQIEHLKRNMAVLIEHQELLAKLRRAAFDSYIKAGFTPEQALELCCK